MRRSRSAALIGAVTLIGFSVFAGALAAHADVFPPSLDVPAATTVDATYLPAGEIDSDDYNDRTMRVSVFAGDDLVNEVGFCTTTVTGGPGQRDWTCDSTVPLSIGLNTLIAVNSDPGDPFTVSGESNHVQITRGGTQPVTVTSPNFSTDDHTPDFTGKGPELGTVSVDDSGVVICSSPVDINGDWACSPATALSTGVHHLDTTFSELIDGSAATPTGDFDLQIVPLPPAMSYSLDAASISATLTGEPTAETNIEFYRATPNGEGYGYGDPVYGCPSVGFEGEGHVTDWSGPPVMTCSQSSLEPGIWNIYSGQRVDFYQSARVNDFVMIPEAPTLGASVGADRSVTISGTGTAGYLVRVRSGDTEACSAEVAAEGTWSCTVAPDEGSYSYSAVQQSQGFNAADVINDAGTSMQGFSAYTAVATVIVPAAPRPPAVVVPPKVPLVWSLGIGGKTEYIPGDETDLTGSGLPPGAPVVAEFHSTPVVIGNTVVKPDGTFLLHVKVPADAEPGDHKFVVTVSPAGEDPSVVEQPVKVMIPAIASVNNPVVTTDPGEGATGIRRDYPGAPSSFTQALPTAASILTNPVVIGGAAAAGLALLIFIALPAELLNSTISEQYGRFAKRLPKVKAPWYERFATWLERSKLLGGVAITLAAAFIFGFADPGFGFDVTSFRVVLACALGLFVVGYLASVISGLIIHRRWQLATVLELKPLGLLLTVIGVVISRLLDFSPGFLVGLILGISLAKAASVAQNAKTTLVQAGVVFGFSVLAWVAYSVFSGSIDANSFGGALLLDSLVATTSEGLTALFVGLLPFKFLDGQAIFAYSKLLWATAYVVAAFAFVAVIVPSANNWGQVRGSLWVWAIVLGGFALASLAVYLYFRFWAPPLDEGEDEAVEQQETATVR